MKDLHEGIIRTPLPPLTTFLDDPLRVLRVIRFAARFDFVVDGLLKSAASSPEVKVLIIFFIFFIFFYYFFIIFLYFFIIFLLFFYYFFFFFL